MAYVKAVIVVGGSAVEATEVVEAAEKMAEKIQRRHPNPKTKTVTVTVFD
jgi:3-keto-L-gulonate-6-phosphate decarboxylase